MEQEIEEIEEAIKKAATDFVKLNALMEEKEAKENLLEEKMDRWVYLNDLAEQIEAQS